MNAPYVFGLNYQSASFDIRERISFSRDEIPDVLHRLQTSGVTSEVIILSTCNRTEIYCITHDIDFVVNAICDIKNICPRMLKQHSYIYSSLECVKHLFSVVSGLESMVLGETEIVAQAKDALNLSVRANCAHSHLSALFQMSFAAAKEVRTTTQINHIAASLGNATFQLVTEHVGCISNAQILFIGAGLMMQQIAPHFKGPDIGQKMIINRTLGNAQSLAKKVHADFADLSQLAQFIGDYNVIIACCSSDKCLITQSLLSKSMESERKILIIDLSMPLITQIELRKHDNISFYSIDDVAKIVDVGVRLRQIAADGAHVIIDDRILEYQSWLRKRGLSPVIKALREHAESIRQDILTVAQQQLSSGETASDVLQQLSIKLTNKLLHEPTVNLCTNTDKHNNDLTNLVSQLYNLGIGVK